jgi:hypothetical protein
VFANILNADSGESTMPKNKDLNIVDDTNSTLQREYRDLMSSLTLCKMLEGSGDTSCSNLIKLGQIG